MKERIRKFYNKVKIWWLGADFRNYLEIQCHMTGLYTDYRTNLVFTDSTSDIFGHIKVLEDVDRIIVFYRKIEILAGSSESKYKEYADEIITILREMKTNTIVEENK